MPRWGQGDSRGVGSPKALSQAPEGDDDQPPQQRSPGSRRQSAPRARRHGQSLGTAAAALVPFNPLA